jgi:hypothetical protein
VSTVITLGTMFLGALLAAAVITRLVTPEKGFVPGTTLGMGLDTLANIFRGVFRG